MLLRVLELRIGESPDELEELDEFDFEVFARPVVILICDCHLAEDESALELPQAHLEPELLHH